jgi:hypothetical protein
MSDLCRLIWCALIGLFRPRAALEATANIAPDDALILSHRANPAGLDFRERIEKHAAVPARTAWQGLRSQSRDRRGR